MKLVKKTLHYICNNTEEVGITIEKVICKVVNIKFNTKRNDTNECYNCYELEQDINNSLKEFLNLIKISEHTGHLNASYDFKNITGDTISVKSNISNDKICPQKVGQPSISTFNKLFNTSLKNTNDFRSFFTSNIGKLINVYLENLFCCRYTIRFDCKNGEVSVFEKKGVVYLEDDCINSLSMSKSLDNWDGHNKVLINLGKEITLQLIEVQVHKNRNSLKIRFYTKTLITLIEKNIIKNLSVKQIHLENTYRFTLLKI